MKFWHFPSGTLCFAFLWQLPFFSTSSVHGKNLPSTVKQSLFLYLYPELPYFQRDKDLLPCTTRLLFFVFARNRKYRVSSLQYTLWTHENSVRIFVESSGLSSRPRFSEQLLNWSMLSCSWSLVIDTICSCSYKTCQLDNLQVVHAGAALRSHIDVCCFLRLLCNRPSRQG